MPVTTTGGGGPSSSPSSSPSNKIPYELINTDKVSQYEHFLNDILRTDLKSTLTLRDTLYSEASQYSELQTILEKLSSASGGDENTKLKTKVDIGSNFYVQAEIPNMKTFTVDLGCGIWLPMSSNEASAYCDRKLKFLNNRIEALTQKELNIKAQINLVIEGLRELQKIQFTEPRRRYDY